jgi:hypothetical protein
MFAPFRFVRFPYTQWSALRPPRVYGAFDSEGIAVTIFHTHYIFAGWISAFIAISGVILKVAIFGDGGCVVDGMEVSAKNCNASGGVLRRSRTRKHSVDQKKRRAEP